MRSCGGIHVAETEDCGAIGDDGDQVSFGCELGHLGRVVADDRCRLKSGRRHVDEIQDVVVANRNLALDFEDAPVAAAELDRLRRAVLRGDPARLVGGGVLEVDKAEGRFGNLFG